MIYRPEHSADQLLLRLHTRYMYIDVVQQGSRALAEWSCGTHVAQATICKFGTRQAATLQLRSRIRQTHLYGVGLRRKATKM